MKNRRKAAAWSGGTLLVVVLAAAVTLHALVDPERLRELAREKALAAWGRDLAIGDVSLDLWPMPTLHAENLALANPEWAQEPHLMRAEHLYARLALLALLTGKVRLKSLDVEGVTMQLETSPDGKSNLPASRAAKSNAPPATDLLDLTALHIKDADIYQRAQDAAPVLWHIEEASLDAGSGLRDVRIQATLARNRYPLAVKAQLADLARFGEDNATTPGRIDLDWGKTQVAIEGQVPIAAALKGYSVNVDLKSTALTDVFEFFGVARRPRAAAQAHLQVRDAQGVVDIPNLDLTLGKLHVKGSAQLALASANKSFSARLEADRMDWAQTMLDLGGPVIGPLPPDRVFRDTPFAWPLLVSLQGTQGSADVEVRSLRLRNGVELHNAKSHIAFEGDRMTLSPFTTELLGGTATGSLVFEGHTKSVKADFHGEGLLLQRWFEERGSQIPLSGGPMAITAKFSGSGDSMKSLAANVTGPITIRMGPAAWASKKAGETEALMTHAFAAKDASEIDFECVVAAMPFRDGVAQAAPIIGFRTTASALVTSGEVDFREETLDVKGRVRPKAGVSLGLAAIAGDVRISGPLRHPKMALDPAGKPATVLRAGVAVATLGLSALGTALADAAEAKRNDPCDAPLRAQ